MEKLKDKLKSVRVRLFFSLCIVVIIIVLFLIIINSVVLESFYLYTKVKTIKEAYSNINMYYNMLEMGDMSAEELEEALKRISSKNDFDILIENGQSIAVFSSDQSFQNTIQKINELINQTFMKKQRDSLIFSNDKMRITRLVDEKNAMNYVMLSSTLDNNYSLYIRVPVSPIQESVKISNELLILIGAVAIVIAGILASYISRKFTEPISELNDIAEKMSKLDFSKKYRIKDTDDEINTLGKSINTMSDKLEATIKQLRDSNLELEKDIEEKSKIDEMRKQFISDVSHELKTPIALIQGYAEGLVENVNSDEESRKFYAEVILDESNKMDTLVKQLLELMKLEYGTRDFNNEKFNIMELINEVIRKCKVMLEDKNIQIKFEEKSPTYVVADEFYIDQVITNYFTNAIKHAKEVDGEKSIKISVNRNDENNKVRISVFNTGDIINDEDKERIWKRFYKIDSSRNREDGGTGIGLALVKAIMTNYENDFGVINHENGVEFYFELDTE